MKKKVIRFKTYTKTSGHFSAKLRINNPDGTQTWFDYDTRGQTEEPSGTILVFNSALGVYEEARNLAHAQEMFAEHTKRLTYTTQLNGRIGLTKPVADTESSSAVTEVVVL